MSVRDYEKKINELEDKLFRHNTTWLLLGDERPQGKKEGKLGRLIQLVDQFVECDIQRVKKGESQKRQSPEQISALVLKFDRDAREIISEYIKEKKLPEKASSWAKLPCEVKKECVDYLNKEKKGIKAPGWASSVAGQVFDNFRRSKVAREKKMKHAVPLTEEAFLNGLGDVEADLLGF